MDPNLHEVYVYVFPVLGGWVAQSTAGGPTVHVM